MAESLRLGLCQLWNAISKINSSLYSIITDGLGSDSKPVKNIFTKKIKIGTNSILIDDRKIDFKTTGRRIDDKFIGDDEKPFAIIHGKEVRSSRVGTLLNPVDSMVINKIDTKKIISPDIEGELKGNSSTSSGINYIGEKEPTDSKDGDFWIDTSLEDPELKIRYLEKWRVVVVLGR